MTHRRTQFVIAAAGAAAVMLGGCASVSHNFAARAHYRAAPVYHHGSGPGPSLVAGDSLAFHTRLAGGYDVTPAIDPGTRFATAPSTTD